MEGLNIQKGDYVWLPQTEDVTGNKTFTWNPPSDIFIVESKVKDTKSKTQHESNIAGRLELVNGQIIGSFRSGKFQQRVRNSLNKWLTNEAGTFKLLHDKVKGTLKIVNFKSEKGDRNFEAAYQNFTFYQKNKLPVVSSLGEGGFLKTGSYASDSQKAMNRATQDLEEFGEVGHAEEHLVIQRETNTFQLGRWYTTYWRGHVDREDAKISGTLKVENGIGYATFSKCCYEFCTQPVSGSFEIHPKESSHQVVLANFKVEGNCHKIAQKLRDLTFSLR